LVGTAGRRSLFSCFPLEPWIASPAGVASLHRRSRSAGAPDGHRAVGWPSGFAMTLSLPLMWKRMIAQVAATLWSLVVLWLIDPPCRLSGESGRCHLGRIVTGAALFTPRLVKWPGRWRGLRRPYLRMR
jgi:hypothetical protein